MRLEELYQIRAFVAAEIRREEEAIAAAEAKPVVNSGYFIGVAAELYSVTVEEVLSDSRAARVVKARQAACWLLRAHGLSFPTIGAALARDHTTVMYACNRVDSDAAMRGLLWPLLDKVRAAA